MNLAKLIEKGGLMQIMTATPATVATPDCSTVAPVATVTVTDEREAGLMALLGKSCIGLQITPTQVRQALSSEDIEDWRKGAISDGNLMALAPALADRMLMEQGVVPEHYTEQATCKSCGPVWLWFAGEVLGCPWCWNRVKGLPVPCPVG